MGEMFESDQTGPSLKHGSIWKWCIPSTNTGKRRKWYVDRKKPYTIEHAIKLKHMINQVHNCKPFSGREQAILSPQLVFASQLSKVTGEPYWIPAEP